MKTYYYDLDDARFVDSAGERIPRCVPELFYQERAEWKIALRDGENSPVDFSRIVVWGAAVADDFRTDSAPMCRTQNAGIAADASRGEVTVSLDCATAEFLACVTGAAEKPARFELYGLDSSGRRLLNVGFDVRARMTLDPDPGIDVHTPDTVATKAFVSAFVRDSGAIASGAEFATSVGGYLVALTSGGGLAVSGGGAQFRVSGGAVSAGVSDGDNQAHVSITSGGIELSASGETNTAGIAVTPGVVVVTGDEDLGSLEFSMNGRPVLTELATATDSETTSVIFDELAGGTSYIYTQPLTSLGFGSVAGGCRAEFDFTAASGARIGLPSGGGVKLIGPSSLDGGAHYLVAVDGARVVVNSYTVAGE